MISSPTESNNATPPQAGFFVGAGAPAATGPAAASLAFDRVAPFPARDRAKNGVPPIDKVLPQLDNVVPRGDGQWSARCPAHNDQTPSLSITTTDTGTVLLCCHRGCTLDEVLAALGLAPRDLFGRPGAGTVPAGAPAEKRPKCVYTTDLAALEAYQAQYGTPDQLWAYHAIDGRVAGYVVRWDATATREKIIRPIGAYDHGWALQHMSVPRPLYALPALAGAETVVVTEGEKAADWARYLGYVGTTSAGGANSAKQTDWSTLAAAKDVWILRDNDEPGLAFAEEAARLVRAAGQAAIKIVLLDGLPDKGDLADFVAERHARGVSKDSIRAEVDAAIAATEPWTDTASSEDDSPRRFAPPLHGETWSDPHRLARLYVDSAIGPDGRSKILQYREDVFRWDGAAYRVQVEADLGASLVAFAREVHEHDLPFREATAAAEDEDPRPVVMFPVTTKVRADVRANLAGIINIPDVGRDPPMWLDGDGEYPAAEVISTPITGLTTLDRIASEQGPFSAPTTRFFTTNALPFALPKTYTVPVTWLRCLREWFNGDADSIAGLQEMFGYLLTATTAAHVIFFVVGASRSGKGTIGRVVTKLIGHKNVASTNFAALSANFGLESLLGKRLALIPDARLSGRADTCAIVERLLSISGEDAQSVDRKNRTRITTTLGARFLMMSNELPRLPDASGALAGRFLIFRTPNSWKNREDRGLDAKLETELPGILKWAAEGWARLKANGLRFTRNAAASEYGRELEDLSSPVKAFLRECCRVGPEHEVPRNELAKAWQRWNAQHHRQVGSDNIFAKDLRAALPQLGNRYTRPTVGRRVRMYVGVSLKPAAEWGEDEDPVRVQAGACTRLAQT